MDRRAVLAQLDELLPRGGAVVLVASPFCHLDSRVVTRRLTWDVDGLIGLQLSYSYSSPARLGDRLPAFVRKLRQALLADNPAGRWEQELSAEVLVARRPVVDLNRS
ncbi:hypothetical protein [Nonomuraea sp. NPDC049400]|uniref:hypothetical protein n=1 Tax=Nonomuraea sp. NPDC049400 TaxID=3364352 RepID=UPI00378E368B